MPTRPRTVNHSIGEGAGTALPDLVELQIGNEIVLLGRCIAVGLPRELCRSEAAHTFFRQVLAAPEAMSKLRRYWSQYRSSQETARAPDHDLLRAVGGALQTGELEAVVFRRASPSTMIDGPSGRSIAPVPPSSSGSASPAQPRPFAAPGQLPGTPVQLAGIPGQSRPVGQWSTEERVAEVIRRAVPKVVAEAGRRAVPKVAGDQGEALLSLLTKENVAIVVGTIGFGAVANLTPYDWAADPSLLGVAYAFGGLMAIHFGGLMGILALGDLVDCLELISSAKSDQDLDAAADALARAVVALGVAGVMAVLHRVKERAATRSASGAGAGSDRSQSPPPRKPPRPLPRVLIAPIEPPAGPRSTLPQPPPSNSPQADALIAAARSGTPFCEECARRAAAGR
jgi:hypothetical protein